MLDTFIGYTIATQFTANCIHVYNSLGLHVYTLATGRALTLTDYCQVKNKIKLMYIDANPHMHLSVSNCERHYRLVTSGRPAKHRNSERGKMPWRELFGFGVENNKKPITADIAIQAFSHEIKNLLQRF